MQPGSMHQNLAQSLEIRHFFRQQDDFKRCVLGFYLTIWPIRATCGDRLIFSKPSVAVLWAKYRRISEQVVAVRSFNHSNRKEWASNKPRKLFVCCCLSSGYNNVWWEKKGKKGVWERPSCVGNLTLFPTPTINPSHRGVYLEAKLSSHFFITDC